MQVIKDSLILSGKCTKSVWRPGSDLLVDLRGRGWAKGENTRGEEQGKEEDQKRRGVMGRRGKRGRGHSGQEREEKRKGGEGRGESRPHGYFEKLAPMFSAITHSLACTCR